MNRKQILPKFMWHYLQHLRESLKGHSLNGCALAAQNR